LLLTKNYPVKKNILLITCIFYITNGFAQEIIERKARLTNLVIEKYQAVIKTDREVKQGLYQAFYNKKIIIASGKYTNDKRTGMWHFYNTSKTLVENFNYDTNRLLYEAPEDTTSNIRYVVDDKLNDTDRVTKPIRPGGRYYGYVPYLRQFKLPDDMGDIDRRTITVILELLVSPGGRLADYKIHVNGLNYQQIIPVNINRLSDEDKMFVPASLNYQPISSRIFIECYINNHDDIDM
jgi:hypothetical protein